MALKGADFTHPVGELRSEMFPGDSLYDNLAAWIAEAESKAASNEDAQKAWVYYRAWTAVADRMLTDPATIDIDGEGSRQYVLTQMQLARGRASFWRAEYESETSSQVAQRSFPVMRSLR